MLSWISLNLMNKFSIIIFLFFLIFSFLLQSLLFLSHISSIFPFLNTRFHWQLGRSALIRSSKLDNTLSNLLSMVAKVDWIMVFILFLLLTIISHSHLKSSFFNLLLHLSFSSHHFLLTFHL